MPALADRLTVLETVVSVGTRSGDAIDPGKFIHAHDGTRHYADAADATVLRFE